MTSEANDLEGFSILWNEETHVEKEANSGDDLTWRGGDASCSLASAFHDGRLIEEERLELRTIQNDLTTLSLEQTLDLEDLRP
jgi:hypothetical protein